MLMIPPSVTVKRNPATEEKLNARCRELLEGEERSGGIHASDLLDIRKAFFRHTDPQAMTEREVWTFMVGKLLHAFILVVIDDRAFSFTSGEESKHSDLLQIQYSPDKLMKDGVPREIKTARNFFMPVEDAKGNIAIEDVQMYVEQVMIYMAAENKTTGMLDVLYLNAKDKTGRTFPQVRSYKITLSDEDLVKLQAYLLKKRDKLTEAIKTGDFRKLEVCREWLCNPKFCSWYEKCQPEGRYGRTEEPTKVRKATKAKGKP